jgi:hypothetical protein
MHRVLAVGAFGLLLVISNLFLRADEPLVGKRGLCITPNALKAIGALNVAWCYNWAIDRPDGLPGNIEYVPMVWGWNPDKSPAAIEKLIEDKEAGKFTTLLGFNEPDGTFANGGCSMPVQDALAAWPELMKVGARLGSPGTVNAEGQWMKDFMAGVDKAHLRVDFITVHWYSYPNAFGLLAALDRIHKLYHRPIWITEFAPTAWDSKSAAGNYIKPAMVKAFMDDLLPSMQASPYIERYAWFSAPLEDAHMGCSGLFNVDGSLTDAGKIYASGASAPVSAPADAPAAPATPPSK